MSCRRAVIRTGVDDPEAVAATLRPDNTDEMTTRVEDGAIVTEIARTTTGGLQSTVDDYLVNLDVAVEVAGACHDTDPTTNHTEP